MQCTEGTNVFDRLQGKELVTGGGSVCDGGEVGSRGESGGAEGKGVNKLTLVREKSAEPVSQK